MAQLASAWADPIVAGWYDDGPQPVGIPVHNAATGSIPPMIVWRRSLQGPSRRIPVTVVWGHVRRLCLCKRPTRRGVRAGRSICRTPASGLRGADRDPVAGEVHVAPAQRDQLADSQAGEHECGWFPGRSPLRHLYADGHLPNWICLSTWVVWRVMVRVSCRRWSSFVLTAGVGERCSPPTSPVRSYLYCAARGPQPSACSSRVAAVARAGGGAMRRVSWR